MNYDLEERTARFGEEVVAFCRTLKQDPVSRSLISQLTRSGTSVGANYVEANGASSRKDFRNKIFICKKEAKETRHWLRMMSACFPEKVGDIEKLDRECLELIKIFQKITMSLKDGVDIKN